MSNGDLRYNFDQVSIMGRSLYITGWSERLSPRVILYGKELSTLWERVDRPDVANFFGDPSASKWGFVIMALLPPERIDRTQLVVELHREAVFADPARHLFAMEDQPGIDMIEGFLATVAREKGSLIEIGSRARSGNSYRNLFPDDINYRGLDITPGPNVDIVGDAHEMSLFVHERFDFAFSISVFEHLLMPWKVAIEMGKILKLGGMAYIMSHSAYPLHDEPWDFWRYSKEAWGGIFNAHTGFEVVNAQYRLPAQVVPKYISDPGLEDVSSSFNYLASACVVRKISEPIVEWSQKTSDVYNLNYDHGAG